MLRRPAACRQRLPLLALLPLVAALSIPTALRAQATPAAAETLYELTLHDGSSFVGRVVAETADSIRFETVGGLALDVARDRIRSLRPVPGRVVDGEFWRQDPNRSRLLLVSPTARTIPRGDGYLSAFWVVFPFVGYGITDDFTLAAGTPLVPEVIGRVLYVAPKFRFLSRPGLDLAAGVLALFATEALDEGSVGILYGVGTFGDPDRAVTAGIGWGWSFGGDDPTIHSDPLLMLGGEYRVGRGTKLLTENFFVPTEGGGLLTGGLRFFGERLSVDFGLATPVGWGGDFFWFPVLNFVYNF